MPLPSSGAISMSQVNVELGRNGSLTISLNDTIVRTLFVIPSGQISLSNGYGKSNITYFIATIGGTNAEVPANGTGIKVDSSNNIYVGGYTYSTGTSGDMYVVKISPGGVFQWYRSLGDSSDTTVQSFDRCDGLAVSPGGRVYLIGSASSTAVANRNYASYTYYETGGSWWGARAGFAVTGKNSSFNCAASNNSGTDYYAAGIHDFSNGILHKIDSTTRTWGRMLAGMQFYSIAVDSSNNVYAAGRQYSGSYNSMLIAKYNSSGTIQWQRLLNVAGDSSASGLATDSVGDVYIAGNSRGIPQNTGNNTILAKYTSSGTLSWCKALYVSGTTSFDAFYSVACDSSNNVYAVGISGSTGIIAKYNSTGTLQWQRSLAHPSLSISLASITIDGTGIMCISGRYNNDQLILKLPTDGSKTGTYGGITYAASSLLEYNTFIVSGSSTSTLVDSATPISSLNYGGTSASPSWATSTTTIT